MLTPVNYPIEYQIVITAFPPEDNSPAPNYSADIDPKRRVKPYTPKHLSKILFLDCQILGLLLLAPINYRIFSLCAFIGAAKPFIDWKLRGIIPKDLNVDVNMGDFGKMSREAKLSYFVLGLSAPAMIASATKSSVPYFSAGVVGYGAFYCFEEFAQRLIRWINPIS